MSKIDEMIGNTYNRWTVMERDTSNGRNVICVCDCGTIKSVDNTNIRKGLSKSCGCLSAELTKVREVTHGMSYTPTWKVWTSMINRAYYYTSSHSFYYKEKGISVCSEWVESFDNFYKDMGEKPEGLTLERIDNLKGYYKENCRWDTRSRQSSNRGNCRNSSGRLGLSYDNEKDKWRVILIVNKKRIEGGRFSSKEAAINKLDELELKYLGKTREEYT